MLFLGLTVPLVNILAVGCMVECIYSLKRASYTCNAFVQRWRRSQFGTGNGFNLGALYAHPQQQVARREKAVVVRASEVAVKEESGSPSLGLEVVETIEPNSRVNTNPSPFSLLYYKWISKL